jgi:hypothetical protein
MTDGYINSKRERRRIQKDREQEEKDLLAVSFFFLFLPIVTTKTELCVTMVNANGWK